MNTAALLRHIHQQITSPASLLLASGIGFLVGALTHRNPPKTQSNPNAAATVTDTPLQTVLNLITFSRTLYTTVLPLVWMVKAWQQ